MQNRINYAALARRVLAPQGQHTTYSLGKELGLSQAAVSRLAAGRTKCVSADAAIELIRMVGGSVSLPEELQGESRVTA